MFKGSRSEGNVVYKCTVRLLEVGKMGVEFSSAKNIFK